MIFHNCAFVRQLLFSVSCKSDWNFDRVGQIQKASNSISAFKCGSKFHKFVTIGEFCVRVKSDGSDIFTEINIGQTGWPTYTAPVDRFLIRMQMASWQLTRNMHLETNLLTKFSIRFQRKFLTSCQKSLKKSFQKMFKKSFRKIFSKKSCQKSFRKMFKKSCQKSFQKKFPKKFTENFSKKFLENF